MRHMALAGMTAGVLAIAAFLIGDRPRRREMLGFVLIAVFILYISTLPKIDGTTTRWYFVLPTMLALAVFSDERRAQVIQFFTWIFAASLVPGIIASFCTIALIPINFEQIPLLNPVMAGKGSMYLHVPGALLLAGNQLSLPWGGELYRLCAMYDEPGMVGTIAAFLLAGHRFRLNRAPTVILLIGGTLSFSLAFIVMAALGFFVRLVYTRSLINLVPLAILGLVGLMVLGIIKPQGPTPQLVVEEPVTPPDLVHELAPTVEQSSVETSVQPAAALELKMPLVVPTVTPAAPLEAIALGQPQAAELMPAPAKPPAAPPVVEVYQEEQHLRQIQAINNRSLPEMDRLVERYWNADAKGILFGLGADSSVVYGGVSQVVTRLLTDFGLIGAVLFAASMLSLGLAITKNSQRRLWALLFFGLFALSVYQRPIVWMPYAFTLFICCSTFAGRRETDAKKTAPAL